MENVRQEFKNDKDVVLAAVTNYGEALQYASEVLKNDKDVVLTAVMKSPGALQYASEKFQNDPILLQYLNLSHSFLIKILSALAISVAIMTIGVLVLASVIIPPVAPLAAGIVLATGGAVSCGLFSYKAIKHQFLVDNYNGNENIPK